MAGGCPFCGAVPASEGFAVVVDEGFAVLDGVGYVLTPDEATILEFLHRRSPLTVTREAMHNELYGLQISGGPEPKIIDVRVCHLRRYFAGTRLNIETIWGTGYRLRVVPLGEKPS